VQSTVMQKTVLKCYIIAKICGNREFFFLPHQSCEKSSCCDHLWDELMKYNYCCCYCRLSSGIICKTACLHGNSGHCEILSRLCSCLASTSRTVAATASLSTTAVDLSRCIRKLDLRPMVECTSHCLFSLCVNYNATS